MRLALAWCPLINHRGNPVPMYRAQMHCVAVNFVASTCGVRQDSRAPEFLYHTGTNMNASTTNTAHHENNYKAP